VGSTANETAALNLLRTKLFIPADYTWLFGEFYMLYMMVSRHSPESCPYNNEKVRKAEIALDAKVDKLFKKHGIKAVGTWVSVPEHLIFMLCDAPSVEALMKFLMEPEVMDFLMSSTTEMHPVLTIGETMKLMK
jgi:hypothetical protein